MKKVSFFFVLIAAAFFIFTLWWRKGLSSVDPKDKNTQVFVIAKGESVKSIGEKLKEKKIINDALVFTLYVRLNNFEKNIQAGSYKISPSMDIEQLMKSFKSGSEDIWITIPEGFRATEVAEVLEDIPTYNDSWVKELEDQEGYLFPDTYLVAKDAEISSIISMLKNTFNKKIESIGMSPNDNKLNNIVIIASLIEREALKDNEKPMISSVIHNRLDDGMALDIDATLQYIKGKTGDKWWSVPTASDKALNSLYNTYKYAGLPPGPISNPGIEAIKAAANPANSDYYFYIHDNDGNVHFAETLSEHERNIEKYLR